MDAPSRLSVNIPHEARFSAAQYRRIATCGALDGLGKIELHRGRIIVLDAQHVPHGRLKTELGFALRDAVRLAGLPLRVLIETDVDFANDTVLQPDVTIWDEVVVTGAIPVDRVRLVIEVADITEPADLGWKCARYAKAGIAEYRVAVSRMARFERFAEPRSEGCMRHDSFAFAEGVSSLTLQGVAVPPGLLGTT